MSEVELYQWAHYVNAYGPLDWGARLFARLDAGIAAIQALIINRSGGVGATLSKKGEAVNEREFMWEPGPEPAAAPEPQGTVEVFGAMFGVDIKKAKLEAQLRKAAKAKEQNSGA